MDSLMKYSLELAQGDGGWRSIGLFASKYQAMLYACEQYGSRAKYRTRIVAA